MQEFLKTHREALLAILAVCLLAISVGSFIWGVIFLSGRVGEASRPTRVGGEEVLFQIDSVRSLDLRGFSGKTYR